MAIAGNAVSAHEANTSGSTLAFCSLANRTPSRMCRRRAAGSATPVASDTSMPDTRLPRAPCSAAVRTDTGTRATSDVSGSSPRAANRVRRPPAVTPRTTSLAVAPNTAATRLTSASGRSAKATRRCGEMARLIEVGGAWNGAGGSSLRTSRLRALTARAVCTVRATERTRLSS